MCIQQASQNSAGNKTKWLEIAIIPQDDTGGTANLFMFRPRAFRYSSLFFCENLQTEKHHLVNTRPESCDKSNNKLLRFSNTTMRSADQRLLHNNINILYVTACHYCMCAVCCSMYGAVEMNFPLRTEKSKSCNTVQHVVCDLSFTE